MTSNSSFTVLEVRAKPAAQIEGTGSDAASCSVAKTDVQPERMLLARDCTFKAWGEWDVLRARELF